MSASEEVFGMKIGRRIIRVLKRIDGKPVQKKTLIITKPSRRLDKGTK